MQKNHLSLLFILTLLASCHANPPRETSGSTGERSSTPAPVEYRSGQGIAAQQEAPATNGGGYLAGDGPGRDIPANINNVPDAVPKAEPLHRYANRPYTVLGKTYTPLTQTGVYRKRGIASWYGKKFHGQRTSIGEIYDMYGMSAAHTTLPIPSYARVTNVANGKSVIVRVNDRGPFMHERLIDLSYAAAAKLGLIAKGQGEVEVESISADGSILARKEPMQVTELPPEPPVTSISIPEEKDGGKTWLQLGAFSSEQGAESFLQQMRDKLASTGKQLSIASKNGLYKVRIGPYSTEGVARSSAQELQSKLGFKPMVSVH